MHFSAIGAGRQENDFVHIPYHLVYSNSNI